MGQDTINYWTTIKIDDVVKNVDEAIRVMVTGRRQSPDLFSIIKILGKENIRNRVELYKKSVEK